MGILGSHHIAVATPNLERLVAFYTGVLGFPVVGHIGDGITFVDIGGTRLELIEKPEITQPQEENRKGPMHIAFEVDDVQRTCQDLAQKGVQFHIPAREARPGIWVAFFRDPDGNVLELFRATPEALA